MFLLAVAGLLVRSLLILPVQAALRLTLLILLLLCKWNFRQFVVDTVVIFVREFIDTLKSEFLVAKQKVSVCFERGDLSRRLHTTTSSITSKYD